MDYQRSRRIAAGADNRRDPGTKKKGLGSMKQFFRAIAAAMLVLAATGAASAKDWSTVRIGTEGAYPPFNSFDSDKNLIGFDIDIAKALCDHMKVKCTFVAQDWDGIIPALLAKKYDAIIASMSITAERMKKVGFTNKYYNTPARFITCGKTMSDASPAGLKGKTIGAQSSTTHSTYLEDVYKDSKIKLYGTQDEANLDLKNGRLDAVLADSIVLLEWTKGAGKGCKFFGPDIKNVKYFGKGAGIAVRKEDGDLKAMFNKALAAIIKDGTYEKINQKYFPFSIY